MEPTPAAKPVKCRVRNYPPAQKTFLRKFVKELVRQVMAYPNPASTLSCASLFIWKPVVEFRCTAGVRPVNEFKIFYHFTMSSIEIELTTSHQSACFANFDFVMT